MSSTRTAKDDSVYHQERYASSPEFERGLNASRVAARCDSLKPKADRNLIWGLHYLSHQPGGLTSVAETLVSKHADLFGTKQMVKIGKRAGQNYTAEEVRKIRQEMPPILAQRFPLRGETESEMKQTCGCKFSRFSSRLDQQAKISRRLMELAEDAPVNHTVDSIERMFLDVEFEEAEAREREESGKNPTSYPVNDFLKLCHEKALTQPWEANSRPDTLDNLLRELCLNPGVPLHSDPPWYFFNLDTALERHMEEWIAQRTAGVVVTALGKEVHEMLNYTLDSGLMTLLEGDARTGKSFAARSWCEQHPGQARFVEVPPGNDDASFFRALARGLGLGNFLNYKVGEIKPRVESVLLTGDILLVLDESQRLWPQMNLRYGAPKRIDYIMTWADKTLEHPAVPMCLVSTPQFIQSQIAMEKNGWSSAQFIGRQALYKRLPGKLGIEDLMAVASSVLPKADTPTIRAVAAYARTSARYLAAIDSIAARARYIANRAGQEHATTEHVLKAMQESVIPSDTILVRTLEDGRKATDKGRSISPAPVQSENEPPSRGTRPAMDATGAPDFRRRAGNVAELIQS
jgi:hypothetical protein